MFQHKPQKKVRKALNELTNNTSFSRVGANFKTIAQNPEHQRLTDSIYHSFAGRNFRGIAPGNAKLKAFDRASKIQRKRLNAQHQKEQRKKVLEMAQRGAARDATALKRKYPGIEQTKSPAAGVVAFSNLPRAYGNADAGPSGVAGHTSLPQSAPLKTAPVPTEPI